MATASRAGARRCTALKRDGTPCKGWAVRGSDPPRCPQHRDDPNAQVALPSRLPETDVTAEQAETSLTLATIDGVLCDLADKQATLSNYITECLEQGVVIGEIARLFALHGQNAGRLGRLLRDRMALQATSDDGFPEVLAQVLDRLAEDLEVEL